MPFANRCIAAGLILNNHHRGDVGERLGASNIASVKPPSPRRNMFRRPIARFCRRIGTAHRRKTCFRALFTEPRPRRVQAEIGVPDDFTGLEAIQERTFVVLNLTEFQKPDRVS